jgi:hypothetical protein
MSAPTQLELSIPPPRHPYHVPPGDWARPGLVDAGFVERSVAVMRDMPDAEQQLRRCMEESLKSIREIDLVYGTEPNQWATATRERLWLEYFTAEAILRRLKPPAKCNNVRQ